MDAEEFLGTEPEPTTPSPEPDPAAAPVPPAADAPEQFINPNDLPPEIQPHFKRMQAAFTKKMQAIAANREKIELVDRFRSDPEYAKQLVQMEAQRLGLELAKAANNVPTSREAIPPEFVQAVQAELPPELAWMAPAIARSTYSLVKSQTAPMLQDNQRRIAEQRQTEWDASSADFSQRQPGWEAHEDDMVALLEFLRSPQLSSPRFGAKLDLLYGLVTGTSNGAATQRAIDRMASAGRQRTTTGQPSRTTVPNIADRVRKAPNDHAAWQEAAKAAVASLQGGG